MTGNRYKRRLLVCIFCLTAGLSAAAAEIFLWVRATTANLQAEQSNSSQVIAVLPAGTKVTQTEDAGRWVKVRTADGKSGWIYRGKLATEALQAETTGGSGLLDKMGTSVKADEADTSRSIRGLSPDTEKYAKTAGTLPEHKKALEQVLATNVTQSAVERFLRDGNIGEYAK